MAVEILVKQALDEIKGLRNDFSAATGSYVHVQKHEEDLSILKDEIRDIKAKRWIQNTLSAILGAVISLLIAYFIANIGTN